MKTEALQLIKELYNTSDNTQAKALNKTDVSNSICLQVGMKVLVKNKKRYLEAKNTEKIITAELPNYNSKRAFELDNDKGEIWLIEDFEKCLNYPNHVIR